MKVCWVLMHGAEQPLELGHGDPVETDKDLILYDADKNIIGRITRDDLQAWWMKDASGTD